MPFDSHGRPVINGRTYYGDEEGVYAELAAAIDRRNTIPEGAMRVAPGSDAVVWRINSDSCGEL